MQWLKGMLISMMATSVLASNDGQRFSDALERRQAALEVNIQGKSELDIGVEFMRFRKDLEALQEAMSENGLDREGMPVFYAIALTDEIVRELYLEDFQRVKCPFYKNKIESAFRRDPALPAEAAWVDQLLDALCETEATNIDIE